LVGGVLGNPRAAVGLLVATVLERPGERARDLAASGDLKLSVDAVQMRLGGRGGDEQRLRDLAIGEAFGSEPRDPQLSRGQRVAARDRVASWLGAGGNQLGARSVGDPRRAAPMGEVERTLQLAAARTRRPARRSAAP
jgi:hypothetical protein